MNRKIHRWLALAAALPFLVVVVSGCLLQVKRWVPSIQPPSQKSREGSLETIREPVDWNQLLAGLMSVPEARITRWNDVKVIDIRPSLGVARARTKNGYEVQVDLSTGRVLSAGARLSSLLIEIHEGAFFGTMIRNAIFLPTALMMLVVTLTGIWLLAIHYRKKWRRVWSTRKTRRIFALASRQST